MKMTEDKMQEALKAYEHYLIREERSQGTIEKYLRDVKRFLGWSAAQEPEQATKQTMRQEVEGYAPKITKEKAAGWKQTLMEQGYKPVTINSMIASINSFFRVMGRDDCRVRFLRVQKRSFRRKDRELTREDYEKLLAAAKAEGRNQLALLMEAICSTGIRVSEVKYLTVEAARAGRAEIALKGKIRVILLPKKLCRKLLKYAGKQKIRQGEIFLGRSGRSLSRKQIWAEMKRLCRCAGVEPSRVFPHDLRHLFARTYDRVCRDLSRLADLLGHSSMDTTRIYLTTTEEEQSRDLERLQLIT